MGSRVRFDPENLFEVFFEFAKPENENEEICVLQRFPESYKDEEVQKSVPKFVFPYDSYHTSHSVEHFMFVLTDINSQFKFGFCHLSAHSSPHTCLCIVSCLPWPEIFYHLLDHLSKCLNSSSNRPILPLLNLLHSVHSFKPGELVSVASIDCNEKYSFTCPLPNQIPTLPENRNLYEFVNSLDVTAMMNVFASMINERRILMVSQTLSRLTACVAGAYGLIYPMYWQHLYIPVLPPILLDYCCAPMPFIIGLHSSVMKKTRKPDLGDVVLVDVDAGTVMSEYDDLSLLPEDVVSSLKRNIKQHLADGKGSSRIVGDGISRAFLKAMVAMIGGYRDALRFRPGEQITFDPEAFLQSRPAGMHAFLQRALQLQTFQQFVSDRLDMLNAGVGFSDEFDTEVNLYGDQWGTQSRYKDWLNHMKKQGKKLRKEGKDRWQDFAKKVQQSSKKTYKDLKAKIEDFKKDDAENVPTSAFNRGHIAVAYHVEKPTRPPPPNMSRELGPIPTPHQSVVRRTSTDRTQKYRLVDVVDDMFVGNGSVTSSRRNVVAVDDSTLFEPSKLPFMDMNLSNDPDILKIYRKSYSVEDLPADLNESEATTTDTENESTPTWMPSSGLSSTRDHSKLSVAGSLCADAGTDANRIQAPPVPAPRRHNARRYSPAKPAPVVATASKCDQPLIVLDSSGSSEHINCRTGSDRSLEQLEFDPLKCTKDSHSLAYSGSQASLNSTYSGFMDGSMESVDTTVQPHSAPVPRPRKSKQHGVDSCSHNTNDQSRASPMLNSSYSSLLDSSSIVSGNVQPVKEARAMFIQSALPATVNVAPRQSSLDQFDPLASGQLVIDTPFAGAKSDTAPDDNLLKNWDLDFTSRLVPDPRGPCPGAVPLSRPATSVPAYGGYMSMPNLANQTAGSVRLRGGYGAGGVSQPSAPWLHGMRMPRPLPGSTMVTGPSLAVGPTLQCDGAVSPRAVLHQLQSSSTSRAGFTAASDDVVTLSDATDAPSQNTVTSARPHSADLEGLILQPLSNVLPGTNHQWEKFE